MIKSLLRKTLPPGLWTALKRWRGDRHMRGFPARVARHNYHGIPLNVSLKDGLAQGWYDHDWPTQPEIAFLQRSRLKPGAKVFDCGAHQGVVAMVLASVVSPGGKVIAVEALGHNARMAEENLRLNPTLRDSMIVLRAALSDREGSIEFTEDFTQNGHVVNNADRHSGSQVVQAITLDFMRSTFGQPDVVFLDIEGSEQAALKGASDILNDESKPEWFIEVHLGAGLETFGGSAREICDILLGYGYTLFWNDLSGKQFEPLPTKLPDKRFYLCALSPK